jgi:glutamate dehydrogenase (NAD(P)+)
LHDHPRGRKLAMDAGMDIPCDIWIPAARPDVIHADNLARLQSRLVAQGANIPCSMEAEQALAARGLLVLPDFIANAGGVICAAIEFRGGTEGAALALIAEELRANTAEPCSTRYGAPAHCHARRQHRSPPSGCARRCEYGNGMQWRDELR